MTMRLPLLFAACLAVCFPIAISPAVVVAEAGQVPLAARRAVSGDGARQAEIQKSQEMAAAMAASQAAVPSGSAAEYVLGTGDKIKMTVYGEDDLSGEYEVGSTGVVAMPLIGEIPASSLTVREFEGAVRTKLSSGYLRDPRVNVQVINYRPFFILGEVAKPGSYPYVNGMTVLNAVALAGGYTYRANSGGVVVVHANDPEKAEQKAKEDATVMPGDIIRVPERFF